MEFNKQCLVIIDTLNREQAVAFIRFLQSEILRHRMDIDEADKLIGKVMEKFEILEDEVLW